ncbi:MAG TPA: N,N-dimethylformamidase beta subunit family domain-containing protein, partial [Candidatus Binatia bacterium]|nr:N,N-dimethylformamidase beta subunit family domain-containing protein [Candidatus Binatia bacterium]
MTTVTGPRHPRQSLVILQLLVVSFTAWLSAPPAKAADPCTPPVVSPIACENSKPGTPQSTWDISGAGDSTIQGFTTDISVNVGQTVHFKIKTNARAYSIQLYRLGYYGGNGARLVASIQPSASLPQTQPACLGDTATGLTDCGNWAESASWPVPSTAVSGIYLAMLRRSDTGGENQIPFVVRDDAS